MFTAMWSSYPAITYLIGHRKNTFLCPLFELPKLWTIKAKWCG